MFQIESRTHRDNQWSADGIGEPNEFTTIEDADDAIRQLQELGDEWADAEYRVVEFSC